MQRLRNPYPSDAAPVGLGGNTYGNWDWGLQRRTISPPALLPPSGCVLTSIDASASGNHAVATRAPVPEPASLSLLAMGGLALLCRRRQDHPAASGGHLGISNIPV